jgi:hypothetical protein
MGWIEIRETTRHGKIYSYLAAFLLGSFCVLTGAMGFGRVMWFLVVGGIILLASIPLDIVFNILRNRSRW